MSKRSKYPVQGRLFHNMPITEFGDVLLLGLEMIEQSEELSRLIVRDQDALALEKKKLRRLDADWLERQAFRPVQPSLFKKVESESNKVLRTKRRMSPEAVVIFYLVRSYLGDVKSTKSRHFIEDSKTLDYLMLRLGYDGVPGASTILDNLNCLSTETHEALLAHSVSISKKKATTEWKKSSLTLLAWMQTPLGQPKQKPSLPLWRALERISSI